MKILLSRCLFVFLSIVLMNHGSMAKSQETINTNYSRDVTREVLASGYPDEASGYILELVRYIIPPDVLLPIHSHPGMQLGRIESGILLYKVVKGEAKIMRKNGLIEILKDGQETLLTQGDSLIEPGYMVHYGQNKTSEPVIILSSSLLKSNEPKTIIEP
ncbi:cupin domain-containing protein [Geminocystis sp. NIES-3709]|uniref:cupin domain-containing protein n=1 Tax=Geminocystis sp. NIES-3709 TaxID=1617448 RepID=UPI0005FC3A91|nr:cupin domain-containing protein [Geminocystis sp. NIES-3709]BAQ65463.1 cupin 2 [Geminocystis sp. NIES-3709]